MPSHVCSVTNFVRSVSSPRGGDLFVIVDIQSLLYAEHFHLSSSSQFTSPGHQALRMPMVIFRVVYPCTLIRRPVSLNTLLPAACNVRQSSCWTVGLKWHIRYVIIRHLNMLLSSSQTLIIIGGRRNPGGKAQGRLEEDSADGMSRTCFNDQRGSDSVSK